MATIAFISDIHGNLPALHAVLADLDAKGPYDEVVGGGDFVSGGACPERVMTVVRERGWPAVRGNGDEWVLESASAYTDQLSRRKAELEKKIAGYGSRAVPAVLEREHEGITEELGRQAELIALKRKEKQAPTFLITKI